MSKPPERGSQKPPVFRNTITFFSFITVPGLLTGFFWGAFFDSIRMMDFYPPGALYMQNSMGILAFSMMGLFCGSISGFVLYRSFKQRHWTAEDALVFYGGMLVGLLCLARGYEYLLYGEWRAEPSALLMTFQSILLVLLLGFLAVAVYFKYRKLKKMMRSTDG